VAANGAGELDVDGGAAAREVLLLMADADAHWREYDSAIRLLDSTERALGGLPGEYLLKRQRWASLRELEGRGVPLSRWRAA
jgi:hypothetical protein